jgi:hypothetical protein
MSRFLADDDNVPLRHCTRELSSYSIPPHCSCADELWDPAQSSRYGLLGPVRKPGVGFGLCLKKRFKSRFELFFSVRFWQANPAQPDLTEPPNSKGSPLRGFKHKFAVFRGVLFYFPFSSLHFACLFSPLPAAMLLHNQRQH